MSYTQLVQPNPNIPCKPGWCLMYVRQAFGAPAVEPTATAGWERAQYRHDATEPTPGGVWLPLWFSLEHEPAGHVALLAPDGSVYSTTHPTAETPTHHPNLAHLIQAYSYNNPLTYLGWSEDISGVRVIEGDDDLSKEAVDHLIDAVQKMHDTTREYLKDRVLDGTNAVLHTTQAQSDVTREYLKDRIKEYSPASIVEAIPDNIVQDVLDGLAERLAK